MDAQSSSEPASSDRPPEPRAPQQARSLATRRRLLDAATDQLISGGYAALTTVEVAQRAEVSRGAFLHHFPTRASLVAATVEHLVDAQMAEFLADHSGKLAQADIGEVIAAAWNLFQRPVFRAWAELWIAALSDRELEARLLQADVRFTAASRAAFSTLLGRDAEPEMAELARDFSFAVLVGLAFTRLHHRTSHRPAKDYLDVLTTTIAMLLHRSPDHLLDLA